MNKTYLFQSIKVNFLNMLNASFSLCFIPLKKTKLVILAALLANFCFIPASFAENSAKATAILGDGYARMIFTFDKIPNYKLEMLEGVLVIKFNEPIDVEVSSMAEKLADYIVVGRTDPDKTGVRFALSQEIKVNKIEAAEKLFIDLLPTNWTGLPPGLPEEVIAELAARAEEASIAAREKVLREELTKKKNRLIIRYGELPTFTRLFFDWKLNVDTKMERNGDVVTLRFNHYAQPIIKDLKSSPPKYLKKIDYNVTRQELLVNLTLDNGTDVRGFKEGQGFVIDLSNGDGGQIKRLSETINDSEIATMGGLVSKEEANKADDNKSVIKFLAPTNNGNDNTPIKHREINLGVTNSKLETDSADGNFLDQKEAAENKAMDDENDLVKLKEVAELPEILPEAKPEIKDEPIVKPELKPELKPEIKDGPTAKPEVAKKETQAINDPNMLKIGETVKLSLDDKVKEVVVDPADLTSLPKHLSDTSMSDDLNDGVVDKDARTAPKNYKNISPEAENVKVEVDRANREYKITFPFKEDVAVAAFERNDLFWLVFEKNINFDITELEKAAPELIKVRDIKNIDDVTIVRLKLDKRLLSDIAASNSDWILSVGELVLMDTKVLKLDRKYKQDGNAIVQVALRDAGKVHWFTDEEIGDRIAVVTARGPARGILKTHNFVEFSALPTVHGLVFQAISDNLSISAIFDEVVVSNRGGLSLTVGQNASSHLNNIGLGEARRPSAIAFVDLEQSAKDFVTRRRELLELIDGSADEKQRSIYRLEIAEFFLSYQMPNEALGMLKLEKMTNPTVATNARYKSLEGAALTLAGKYKAAINALSAVAIRNNKTSALFRAVSLAKTGMHQEAIKEFDASLSILAQLPSQMEADLLITAIESALEIPNLNVAQKHLIMLKNVMQTRLQEAKYWLLMAHFSRLNDDIPTAKIRYKEAIGFDIRPVTAEAEGYLSIVNYQTGESTIDEAIDELNGNVVTWRGDKIEQLNTVNLGKLYIDKNAYHEGLTVLKYAASKFGATDLGRETATYMADVFESLYLGGKSNAMAPFKALSLFYDFRELTPIGRKGDAMIRVLVDRLIDVDLLDQAIELLDHQVNKRLKGIAKADVAAKLAMVQLLNYQPEKAIRTIAKSRIADMPKHIARRRDILESRALVEIGRIRSSITRLEGYTGRDISLIKAEAYWRGNFWQKAGEEFESMILNRWEDDIPLIDQERHLLIRSAIAYKMANDTLSLGRLRKQYMRKMENTSHAGSFNLVVDVNKTDAVEFRKLAREVAEVDMLKDFIAEFRENEAKDIRDIKNN